MIPFTALKKREGGTDEFYPNEVCGWNSYSKISFVSVDEMSTNLKVCCEVYGHKREGTFSSLHLWMVLMEVAL